MALVVPLIEAAGAAAGGELGAFEAASYNVGSAGATYYGSKFVNDNVDPAIDSVFGKGSSKKFRSDLEDAFMRGEGIIEDFKLGRPLGYTNAERDKDAKLYKREHPLTPEETAHLNAYLANKWMNREPCKCPTGSSPNDTTAPPFVPPVIIDHHNAVTDNPSIDHPLGGDGIITIHHPNRTPTGPQDPQGHGIPVNVPLNNGLPLFSTDQINSKDLGYTAGSFIIQAVMNGLSDTDGVMKLLLNNPDMINIAHEYMNYVKTRPVLDQTDYSQVYKVYDGKSITKDKAYVNNGNHYAIVDETGQEEYYNGRECPQGISDFRAIALGFIPPLWGTWVGPKSYNNKLPVDLIDTFSMMHDIEYNHHGWFYLPGDLKYISRLSQNLDRMGTLERAVGKFAIKWFSTAGRALALTLGDLPANVDETPVPANGIGSFYNYLEKKYAQGPTLPTGGPEGGSNYIEFGPSYLNQPINTQGRMMFYRGMREAAEESWNKYFSDVQSFRTGGSIANDILRSLVVTELNG